MSDSQATVLIWLGCLGLANFGGLWLAARRVDAELLEQINSARLDRIIGRRRRRRIDRWLRVAPLMVGVSIGLVTAGVILLSTAP